MSSYSIEGTFVAPQVGIGDTNQSFNILVGHFESISCSIIIFLTKCWLSHGRREGVRWNKEPLVKCIIFHIDVHEECYIKEPTCGNCHTGCLFLHKLEEIEYPLWPNLLADICSVMYDLKQNLYKPSRAKTISLQFHNVKKIGMRNDLFTCTCFQDSLIARTNQRSITI